MAVDGFEIAKVGAGFVVSYIGDQQQAAALAAQMSEQLKTNNAAILTGVAQLLKQTFSQNKLDQCNNMVETLATFMEEYNVNPNDQAKLFAVDQKSGELLEVLDDSDIAVAGIANWMITADIRILALQEKAKIFPADLTNAKNRANDYSAYVDGMKSKVFSGIESRFSAVTDFGLPQPGEIAIGNRPILWGYFIDNTDVSGFGTEAQATDDRDEKIKTMADLPIAKMKEIVEKWKQFARS